MRDIQKGIDLIKKWEGFREKAYKDPVGIWTIGYGTIRYTNGERVKKGHMITRAEAEVFLMDHVRHSVLPHLDRALEVRVTDNQYSALVSFIYNLGAGAFRKSTLLSKLNAEDYFGAADQFDRWVYAGGKKLRGLVKRRAAEKALFKQAMEEVVNKHDPMDLITEGAGLLKQFFNWLIKLLKRKQ